MSQLKDRVIDLMRHGHQQRYPAGDIADSVVAAVLDALQEPSEGMSAMGIDDLVSFDADQEWAGSVATAIWQAMLAKFREEQGL